MEILNLLASDRYSEENPCLPKALDGSSSCASEGTRRGWSTEIQVSLGIFSFILNLPCVLFFIGQYYLPQLPSSAFVSIRSAIQVWLINKGWKEQEGMKVMQKVMLKTVFIFINDNKEFQLPLKNLAKANTVSFNGNKLAKKACPRCKITFDNNLLLILHLQLIHTDNLCITTYEFQKDQMIIKAKDTANLDEGFLKKTDTGEIRLTKSLKERTRAILGRIFNKFSTKKGKNERQYYSSIDVFKTLQDFGEQESIGALQRELQKMRISEFSDVSESDKKFFLIWNDFMSKSRKTQGNNYVDSDTMGEILKKFCATCKGHQVHRNSLLMHLWTLWSAGKIGSFLISVCLDIYDKSA